MSARLVLSISAIVLAVQLASDFIAGIPAPLWFAFASLVLLALVVAILFKPKGV